jgi:magnesium transporter
MPAAEDVCFPTEEEMEGTDYRIDFECLEELAAMQRNAREALYSERRESVLSILKPGHVNAEAQSGTGIPTIITTPPGKETSSSESVDVDSDEKGGLRARRGVHPVHAPEGNRFSFFSTRLEATIHAPEFGDLCMPGESFRDLFGEPTDDGMFWLDVLNPTREELLAFQDAFSIHPLTREDIEMQESREKVELFKKYYFVSFRSFFQMDKHHEDYMEPLSIYLIVYRDAVLSFSFMPNPHPAQVRARLSKMRDYVRLSSDWICYAMIDNIVDSFGPAIHDIELEADAIEDSVFTARTEDFSQQLRQIGECRKKVMGLMRLLGGKADVIKGFAKRCNEGFDVTPRGDIALYLGDVQDHVLTMTSNLGHFEKMLSRSHSNYLAQLTADSIIVGNRANVALGKITLVATVLVPLNLITGLFGMNVPVPGRSTTSLAWFFGIVGVILAVVVVGLSVAKKMRLI